MLKILTKYEWYLSEADSEVLANKIINLIKSTGCQIEVQLEYETLSFDGSDSLDEIKDRLFRSGK